VLTNVQVRQPISRHVSPLPQRLTIHNSQADIYSPV
jgi:hypothetical protein